MELKGILTEDQERVGFQLIDDGDLIILRRWGEKRAVWPRMVCTPESIREVVKQEKER